MASTETAAAPSTQSTAPRSTVGRGPSYPAIDIKEAIERLRAFYNAERRNSAPVAAAARHWGYSEKSSSVRVIAAALINYGLLEDAGSNEARTLKVTARGLDILLDADDSPKRLAAIQAAVRNPKTNAELFARHSPDDLPSDQTLKFYLIREKGFNDGAVDGYLKTLRDSIAYAKLDKPANMPSQKSDAEVRKPQVDPPEVGDLIQWEAEGALRLEAPRRVRAKIEDNGAWWVFVDGSETGIPMDEAVAIERSSPGVVAKTAAPTLPLPPSAVPLGMVDASEQQVASGKFGKGLSYRLLATGGDIGSKELGKIIRLLEAYKEALDDDEEIA